MEYTRYGFAQAVAAFFEMPTADARKLLPPHLQPLEVQHTRSILAITAFEFTESMVGSYNEIVLSIIVPPRVEVGQVLPKAAFFPFIVGTTTDSSREHAIERWHGRNVSVYREHGVLARVADAAAEIVRSTMRRLASLTDDVVRRLNDSRFGDGDGDALGFVGLWPAAVDVSASSEGVDSR